MLRRTAIRAALLPALGAIALLNPAPAATAAPSTPAQAVPVVAPASAAPTSMAPGLAPGHVADARARTTLAQAGIAVWSSGNCRDRHNPRCTSLEGVRASTIEWLIVLQEASGCDLLVTGGTETGHADGTYSHWNGYRIDLNASSCLAGHIRRNFDPQGGGIWLAPSGNQYYNEGSHWDVTFP